MNTVPRTTSRPLSVAAPVRLPANAHFGHVLDALGTPLALLRITLPMSSRISLGQVRDEVLLAALFDIARAHVAVVAVQGGDHILQRHAQ